MRYKLLGGMYLGVHRPLQAAGGFVGLTEVSIMLLVFVAA
jgi:hypothetical protein